MLVVIDQHAADERIRLEQLTQGKRGVVLKNFPSLVFR